MSAGFLCEAKRLISRGADNERLFVQISDPHGAAALDHQTPAAELSAGAHGHSAREAPRGRIRHTHGGKVAPGLLQVGWRPRSALLSSRSLLKCVWFWLILLI